MKPIDKIVAKNNTKTLMVIYNLSHAINLEEWIYVKSVHHFLKSYYNILFVLVLQL